MIEQEYSARPMRFETPVGTAEKRIASEKAIENADRSNFWADTFEAGTMLDEVSEFWDLNAGRVVDDEFEVTPEMHEYQMSEYSIPETEYLNKSLSKDEYITRQQNVQHDRDLAKRISTYGMSGAASTLAFGFVDPVGIAASLVTGGAAKPLQMGRIARMSLAAAAGGLENYGLAKFEQAYNTQMTDTDVVVQSLVGSVLAGGMAGGMAGVGKGADLDLDSPTLKAAKDLENRTIADATNTDVIDVMYSQNASINREAIKSAYYKAVDRFKQKPSGVSSLKSSRAEVRKAQKALDDELQAESESRILRAQEAREGRASDAEVQAEWVSKRTEIEAKHRPEIDRLEQIAKDFEEGRLNYKQAGSVYAELAKLQRNMSSALTRSRNAHFKKQKSIDIDDPAHIERAKTLKANLKAAKKAEKDAVAARKAQNDYNRWQGMSVQDRVEFLFPDGLPKMDTKVDTQSVGAAKAGTDAGKSGYEITDTDLNDVEFGDLMTDFSEAIKTRNFSALKNLPLRHALQAVYTSIDQSASQAVRGFGLRLLENPQGAASGTITGSTASIDTHVIGAVLRTVAGGAKVRNEQYSLWAKAKGISKSKAYWSGKTRSEFDREIFHAVSSPDAYARAPDSVQKAADVVSAQFEETLRRLKEAGVKGFEKVEFDPHYIPKIMDAVRLTNAINKHGREKVLKVISQAFQTGGHSLPREAADMLASRRLSQIMDSYAGKDVTSPDIVSGKENLPYLEEELRKAGVDEGTIQDIINNKADVHEQSIVSDRAKKSFKPNVDAESDGLTYRDLIHDDVENLMENYIRESSANIAMQKNFGVGSYHGIKERLKSISKYARNEGTVKDTESLNTEINMLDQMIDVIYGKGLNKDSKVAIGMQRARALVGLLRLQNLGITNSAEIVRPTVNHGMAAVSHANPLMSRESMAKLGREDLIEIREMMGTHGNEWAFESRNFDNDALDELEGARGNWWRKFDEKINKMQRASSVFSGFRATQQLGENMSLNGIQHNLVRGKIDEAQARDAGWIQSTTEYVTGRDGIPVERTVEKNVLEELKAFMAANPKKSSSGHKMMDLKKMQQDKPELFDAIQRGVARLAARDMMRMHTGEAPLFMNKWLGQTMMQFRTFSYGSISKFLVHDIRGDKAKGAGILLAGLGMGHVVAGVRAGLSALEHGTTFEEEWEDSMTGLGGFYNLLNTSGQFASVGMGLDIFATLGFAPEELRASAENNYKGARTLTPPVAGLVDDARKLGEGVQEGIRDNEWEQAVKAGYSLTPFINSHILGAMSKNLINE